MKSVTSRLQAHSASSVFKTKKMSASACHPKLSCFLDFMLFTVYIAGFECNGKADRTSMPKSAALSRASKSHLIDLLLVPHTCMSPADIPYEFLISSRAGQPNFFFLLSPLPPRDLIWCHMVWHEESTFTEAQRKAHVLINMYS